MKATLISSSISANLGNSREAEIHKSRSSNEEETNWPLRGETLHLLPAAGRGAVIVDSSTSGERTLTVAVAKIPGRRGTACNFIMCPYGG